MQPVGLPVLALQAAKSLSCCCVPDTECEGRLMVNSAMNLRTLWLRQTLKTLQATKVSVIEARIWLRPRQVLPLVLLQGKAINPPQYHTRYPSTTWSAPLVISNSWCYQSKPPRMGQHSYPWRPAEPTEQWRPSPTKQKSFDLNKKKKKKRI